MNDDFSIENSPIFPATLPGSLWCLTTYFNPENLKNKLENYHFFQKNLARQGVKLLTVECGLKNRPFELNRADADKLIQVRSNSILWHKERLLNIGLKRLPADCDKIAWLDADIVFLDDNWAEKTSHLLKQYKIIKPFSLAVRLTKNQHLSLLKSELTENILKSINQDNILYKKEGDLTAYLSVFATAARREVFARLGFYDKSIISNADSMMTAAFINVPFTIDEGGLIKNLDPGFMDDFLIWKEQAWSEVKGSVGFFSGTLLHLFHGDYQDRQYDTQLNLLAKHNYRLGLFLENNSDGCLEWTAEGKKLETSLIKYFRKKNEEKSFKLELINKFQRLVYFFQKNFSWPFSGPIGAIGLFLKKISPPTYYWLKKIIKKN